MKFVLEFGEVRISNRPGTYFRKHVFLWNFILIKTCLRKKIFWLNHWRSSIQLYYDLNLNFAQKPTFSKYWDIFFSAEGHQSPYLRVAIVEVLSRGTCLSWYRGSTGKTILLGHGSFCAGHSDGGPDACFVSSKSFFLH